MDIHLYNTEQFKQQFLDINFDNILIENNNDMVNSSEYYIAYKTEYLENTHNNLTKFTELSKQFNELSDNYTIQNNKYSYTFVDKSIYNSLNNELKKLLIEQRELYNNFLKYIQFLNSK